MALTVSTAVWGNNLLNVGARGAFADREREGLELRPEGHRDRPRNLQILETFIRLHILTVSTFTGSHDTAVGGARTSPPKPRGGGRVEGLEYIRVYGLGFMEYGSGFRVQGAGSRV